MQRQANVAMNNQHLIVVDIADMKVSNDPESTLITYALGSCIAVIIHDPVRKVGGMVHYMLPLSKVNPEKAKTKPAMFADVAIPQLFKSMYEFGCQKKDLIVKVAGGGKHYDSDGIFDIGKRNYTVLRKLFWKNNIMISSEDVGGSKSRTAKLQVGTGFATIKSGGEEVEL